MVDDLEQRPGARRESVGGKEDNKCEFCNEPFDTMEALKTHVSHAHYRDTYKPTDRERRLWAKHCLSLTREVGQGGKRVGRKELDSIVVVDEDEDPDYQEE
jgi:hypothetical protein